MHRIDWWQQGYRMLGAFINCDDVGGEQEDYGDQQDDGESQGSRRMMWTTVSSH